MTLLIITVYSFSSPEFSNIYLVSGSISTLVTKSLTVGAITTNSINAEGITCPIEFPHAAINEPPSGRVLYVMIAVIPKSMMGNIMEAIFIVCVAAPFALGLYWLIVYSCHKPYVRYVTCISG